MKFHGSFNAVGIKPGLWILIAGILITACHQETKPTGVLTPEEMAKVMVDLYLAEARLGDRMLVKDSARKLFMPFEQQLLDKYNLPDSTVFKSYQYYLDHPDEFERIYDSVIDTLNLLEQKLRTSEVKK